MGSLLEGFVESVQCHPDRVALYLGDRRWTYRELSGFAAQIRAAIAESQCGDGPVVGLLAAGSLTAYAGTLAVLGAGRGFLPIDPGYPPQRIYEIVDHAGIDTLVVGVEGLDRLDALLQQVGSPMAVVAPEAGPLRGVAARHPRHRYRAAPDLRDVYEPLKAPTGTTAPAYLIYTSGSTAAPRAVAVSHDNARAYLEAIDRRAPIRPDDRCSHTFPLTFDLSIHDLFATWSAGASLVAWTSPQRMDPSRFIQQHRLTRWFSVPTVAMTMQRLGELSPGRFPTLRDSLFCGEALPVSVARAWAKAAPNSSLFNLYGPTETTVAVTSYRFGGGPPQRDGRRGVVSLGKVFEGQRALVVDDNDCPVARGERGELLLSGSQLADGYWRAPEATQRRFVSIDGQGDRLWFRTGDLVEIDDAGLLHFLGRLDDQIKLRGHHVELSEVDRALRRACGHSMAAAVGWPTDPTGVYGLVGMVASEEAIDDRHLLAQCRRELPRASVPDRIVGLPRLPQNERGKLDRRAMQQLLRHREV